MRVDDRELTADVVKFWRGWSVLEITVDGAGVESSSMCKVSRRLTTEHEPILTRYLTDALQTDSSKQRKERAWLLMADRPVKQLGIELSKGARVGCLDLRAPPHRLGARAHELNVWRH